MIRTLRWLTVVLMLSGSILLISPTRVARAETVEGLADPTNYVNDLAGVLSEETLDRVSALCDRLDRKAHAQIVVVTIKTIDADKSGAKPSLEEFTTALEEKWKVGTKGTDRGVLIVLVMNPRRGRIEVGYGLEGILNDAKVGDIGREMAPYAEKNDYDGAVSLGVKEISGIIAADAGISLATSDEQDEAAQQYHRVPEKPMPVLLKLLIGVIVLVIFLILIATGHVGMAFWFLFNMISMGRGGGDDEGGGGGGFGGGEGGSSGGGGASGDF